MTGGYLNLIRHPADPAIQAAFLRSHCRLFKVGMKHSSLTATELRQKVELHTKRKFKRGDYDGMIAALNEVINASN